MREKYRKGFFQKQPIGISEIFIGFLLLIFSSWTIAYHIVLVSRIPVYYLTYIFFCSFLCILLLLHSLSNVQINKINIKVLFFLLITALIIASYSILSLRPDNDDIEFYHRAFLQSIHIDLPIYLNETLLNKEDLPPISILHLATSYEYFTVFIAHLLKTNSVVIAYQNLMSFFVAFLFPFIYFSIYRYLGFSNKKAFVAVLLVISFLLIDGNVHRSFGNVSFARLWQGKTILWNLLVPISFIILRNFLIFRSKFFFVCLLLIGVCAVGLSNSGVYLFPILIASVAIAKFISMNKKKLEEYRFLIYLGITSIYCVIFGVGICSNLLPMPHDKSVWAIGWPSLWYKNIMLVFDNFEIIIRDFIFLFALPLVTLENKTGKFICLYSISLILLCINPITGPIWLSIIEPASYWRIVYLFPIPLCAGLLAKSVCFSKPLHKKNFVAAAAVISCIVAFKHAAISFKTSAYKTPFEYKFDKKALKSSEGMNAFLLNRNVLAVDEIINILPLINPTIKFEAGRGSSVIYYFNEYGNSEEGHRRANAKYYVETGAIFAQEDFITSILNGVNAVIMRNKLAMNIVNTIQSLKSEENRWKIVYADEDYSLVLKELPNENLASQ
ncbi:hypothetical protein BN59_03368 [Legionella massiliensis]|uniref:Glycosyltransferase RgtA/B/C/D-like domain-containing protein n=1 Tax=Legionella massiliensis TaxID=1034943 RepID=A0A078L1E0_9GAMM|nr:DUF6077 domain-containing protein [Legionella massiliensis]CDZ79052.1 hypothetical protein BN59_03368 [Legionella massiliensis]CEE14790.1 hypothetical protein BN1094_03368 [Legionella massiliensis]